MRVIHSGVHPSAHLQGGPARQARADVGLLSERPSGARPPRERRLQTIIESRVTGAELKKHVGAIHVKAPLSLLQRKLSNVLLLNAYEELPDPNVKEHEIPVRVLAEVAGYDSKDFAYLRDALRALVDCRVEWNVLGENGEEDEWAAASLLAQAKTKGGVCRYVYAPDLREKLYRPEVYARINLAIQARFGSGYALALYENCARFRKVGTTGWIALETWRDLLGVGEDQYPAFKALRQKVLSPAIKEVNEFSDVRVEMETRREKRRIVALKFVVTEAPPHEPGVAAKGLGLREALGAEGVPDARSAAPEPAEVIQDHPLADLQRRLLGFGLTEAQALDLSTEFPEGRVAANLDHVEAEVARGLEPGGREVKNVAAFTVAAVRGDYAKGSATPDVVRKASEKKQEAASAAKAKQERTAAQKEAAAQAKRSAEERRQRALADAWGALSDDEQAGFTERAVARLKGEAPQVHCWYEEERDAGKALGEMRPAVRSTLRSFQYEEMGRLL
ncbi:MAG: replication initiation protein [Bacteroidota bacterium]